MKLITSELFPIKLWLDDLDDAAMQQAFNLANLPFVHKHIAIMPDAHMGFGMPIGGVLATLGEIIPNAVGVDIGCGMCAQKTNLQDLPQNLLKRIVSDIRQTIPVGFEHHKIPQGKDLMPDSAKIIKNGIVHKEYQSALSQMGTLGSGNHFIEIQKDPAGYVWIMIHSGSRNIGLKVAEYYNKLAKTIGNKYNIPQKFDLACLPFASQEGQNYFAEMNYCVEFALANRLHMMNFIKNIFSNVLNNVEFLDFINIAHNYAALEEHFGEQVIVHRKGATSAKAGELGIIPGAQGRKSYIVKGKGNPESFHSCSYGAGRIMSRAKAKDTLNLQEEINKLNESGILHGMHKRNDLDEAASAYKDLDQVMQNQTDLVEIVTPLFPLAVIKG